MLGQKLVKNRDCDMAEKCRKALAKEHGFDIPLPKSLIKRAQKAKNN